MNKRVNILSFVPCLPSMQGTKQFFYIKGTKTKKYKPNKNLSHTIQFTSHVQPRFRVYDNINGSNKTENRQTGCWTRAIRS